MALPASTLRSLADAEAALGQLAGVGRLLPNPDLLVRPYLLREALSSTRIEGTQATMAEVFEVDLEEVTANEDVEEVVNYVGTMQWGLDALERLPFSTRLLREMHRRLMAGVRGRERRPGELRTSQNWIGAEGATIETARFVPPHQTGSPICSVIGKPSPTRMPRCRSSSKTHSCILSSRRSTHSSTETVAWDGSCSFSSDPPGPDRRAIALSELLSRAQSADLLRRPPGDPRDGRPDPVDRALPDGRPHAVRGRRHPGRENHRTARELPESASAIGTPNAMALAEQICENPIVNSRSVEARLGVSRPTALRLLKKMEERGVLREGKPGARGQRRYVAREMMEAVAGDSRD